MCKADFLRVFSKFDQHYSTMLHSIQAKHFKTARKAYKEKLNRPEVQER